MPKILLRVSDHALLRYLERVRGFKFDREKEEIKKICAGTANATVKAQGCLFEVVNGTVVTVVPDTNTPCRTKREQVRELKI